MCLYTSFHGLSVARGEVNSTGPSSLACLWAEQLSEASEKVFV